MTRSTTGSRAARHVLRSFSRGCAPDDLYAKSSRGAELYRMNCRLQSACRASGRCRGAGDRQTIAGKVPLAGCCGQAFVRIAENAARKAIATSRPDGTAGRNEEHRKRSRVPREGKPVFRGGERAGGKAGRSPAASRQSAH